jgi:hypothetical protein
MSLNSMRARKLLKEFDFRSLFIDEMGWDKYQSALEVILSDRTLNLAALAHKRGMVAYHCPTMADEKMPDYALRRKIEHQVAKSAHEHFIVFTDNAKTTQIWQWVRREPGKPTACREHIYHASQPGDALLQKLETIAFSLDEEDKITLPDVTGRARAAFDVERVTKRFYDQFQKEHAAFLKFITGIPESGDHEWYASVMLNRLMFVYFMQRKGFLDDDRDYLRNRLAHCRKEKGHDKFYSFYRYFLLRLFHEGLGGRKRDAELEKLVGRVPYLNGGIFDIHELERPDRYGKAIVIPDKAFERIFDYFDQYQWHLDERPLRADNEINPDVLGYIFEKYINQKQMGAYYTKEDITDYISKNAVLPFLFDAARPKCKVAFENPGGPTLWNLLRETPDRYIYPAVCRGMDKQLPDYIAAGLASTSKRTQWNKSAPSEFGLPTEIWREVVARRKRCEAIRCKLAAGEVRNIDDLITFNLDIRQFAQDVIENCEGPELLRAFWYAIGRITILDPTCGSGAFLFAALNILEPLYEACLDRMEAFVDDLDRSGEKHRPEKFSDFRKVLERVATHPNRRYFIFKSIILNNLFGVDLMEEAIEICKLRLFLKLAAQVEPEVGSPNNGIEPLPDIDFNIRAGNTLVGYLKYEDVQNPRSGSFDFDSAKEKIASKAADLQQTFDEFRHRQIEGDGSVPTEHKLQLRQRLASLQDELNRFIASEYGVKTTDKAQYAKWLKLYQPFHWFIEFYKVLNDGGFDVVIGNPPYLERRQIEYEPKNYVSLDSGAVHAFCIERSIRLLHTNGSMSMIVPLALPSTQRMHIVQRLIEAHGNVWYANYAWRPGKLFDAVNRALTIFVATPAEKAQTFSTQYQKWTSSDREDLFKRLSFTSVPRDRPAYWVPKLGNLLEEEILAKCLKIKTKLAQFTGSSTHRVYYRTTGGLYWKVFTNFAPKFRLNGKAGASSRETSFSVARREYVKPIIAILSSDIFWWWYTISSNLRDLNPSDIQNFPVPQSAIIDPEIEELGEKYLKDIDKNSSMLIREQKQTGRTETQSFKIQRSKPIIEQIDRALAAHYGFNAEELDFIINYDVKYRMGSEDEEE